MRELLKLHLVNQGYEVLLAADAIDGGRLLLTADPNLLIVDPALPVVSGFEPVATLPLTEPIDQLVAQVRRLLPASADASTRAVSREARAA